MRKTFSTLFVFTIISFNAFSQGIVCVPNDSAAVTANVPVDPYDPVEIHIHVVNNFGQATSFMWMMKDYSAPSAVWELKLCDNNNCYDLLGGSPVHESLTVNAGDTMDMKFQYAPHLIPGFGNCNVLIYVTGDSATTAVTLNYAITATSPNSITALMGNNPLKIYPNPVQKTFTVSGFEKSGNLSFEVYDLKGAVVKSEVKNATNTQIEISVEHLSKGEYVLKAFDANGKVAGTSHLTKVD